MNLLKRCSGELWMMVWWLLLLFVTRAFPFRSSSIPLWYDPGLYKSMFLSYTQLWVSRDFSSLPAWILSMYEPWLGMEWSLRLLLTWWRTDSLLTIWIILAAFLPAVGVWLLARRRWRFAWTAAFLLAIFSFTQYQVFWWHYWKQLIAMFFVAILVWWRDRRKRRQMVPIVAALFLIHRPAAVLVACVAIIRGITLIFCRAYHDFFRLCTSVLISLLLTILPLAPFWETLFAPLFWFFITEIDLPTINESFQQWGTFLTVREYLLVGWLTLLWALWWVAKSQKIIKEQTVALFAFIILFLRVFGQWFFFQRMIWYLDMFVLVFAGVCSSLLRKGQRWKKMIVILLFCVQIGMMIYRTYRTYRPLIEQEEFAFISQMGTTIENDAVIIVPGINYSPRVQWRTQREVIAPWLFDMNRRWFLDGDWTTKWIDVSAEEKCRWLLQDYPELVHRPLYLWIWSKQELTDIQGACFVLLQAGKSWSRRKVVPSR